MIGDEDDGIQDSFFSMVTGQNSVTHVDDPNRVDEADSEAACDQAVNEGAGRSEAAAPTVEDALPTASASTMPHDARRVLVHLMRQGVIIAAQKPKLFELVCRYEAWVRRHLSEVYLQLVLDDKAGVVFVAVAGASDAELTTSMEQDSTRGGVPDALDSEGEGEFTTLIPKRTLSLYDTLILLVLRKHYQERESGGEQKITIDIERLESYLTPFLPLTDHASKDRKKLLARVKVLVSKKILATLRGSEERYEITPLIRYVVSASFLESMLAEYVALASGQTAAEAETGIDPSVDTPDSIDLFERAEKGKTKTSKGASRKSAVTPSYSNGQQELPL